MEKLKNNLENNLNIAKEEITDNEDESITFIVEETTVTVDKYGKVELGKRVEIINATKIEVEDLTLENGVQAEKLKVTTIPSKITEKLIYTSKNTEIITVDEEGNVTAKEEGEAQVEVQGEKSGVKGECTVTVKFGVGIKVTNSNKLYTDDGLDTAMIPVGYRIVPGLNDISEGLVISDDKEDTEIDKDNIVNKGNQFVWIPVEDAYEANKDFDDKAISAILKPDQNYLPKNVSVPSGKTEQDVEKELVTANGGFYIARYEAGDGSAQEERTDTSGTTGKLVSKKDTYIYNYITQQEAKEKAKEFVNNEYIKSGLITGIQWDMAMKLISKSKLGLDGTYDVTKPSDPLINRHTRVFEKTGKNELDRVCNIYDLEGNYWEFAAEITGINDYYKYILRGGNYANIQSAANRYNVDGNSDVRMAFRFILYVM